jgi:hypothetical protein
MKRKQPRHKMHRILTGYFVPGYPFRPAYDWSWFKGMERRERASKEIGND